jgi:hypothetical protein
MGKSRKDFEEGIAKLLDSELYSRANGQVIWKNVPVEPNESNGTWDAKTRELRWDARAVSGATLPQVLFAKWGEPDEKFQRRHLGWVALSNELVEYNEWYFGLDADQRGQWDAFVATLSPGPKLIQKLNQFRFTVEEKPVEAGKMATDSGAVTGAQLIVSGLNEEQN